MREENWQHDYTKSLDNFINGREMCSHSFFGHQFIDESFYRIFNAYHNYTNYELPSKECVKNWTSILDTNKSKIIT
jgi:glycogen operon protein